MEITLGPALYGWKKDALFKFYEEAAKTDADTVYLGEAVCSRRQGLSLKDLETVGRALEKSGKKAVISTLAIISNEEDLTLVKECLSLPFAVEANDMGVFGLVERTGLKKELYAGPHIEAYNRDGAIFLKTLGARRITFPVELSIESVRSCIEDTGIEAEVFAHGKAPLAFSWRCYTSRAHGLKKSDCVRDCEKYPDGMETKTLDGEDAFTINGTSVLSLRPVTLIECVDELRAAGVKALRISPDKRHTAETIRIFRARINGEVTGAEALKELTALYGRNFVNGWAFGKAGKDYIAAAKEFSAA